jgi:hypothetical protein
MDDWLAVFATSPNRQCFPHRPNCTFQSLYHPHILDNIESQQVFPNKERNCAFIHNEPLKSKELYP